jgi:hypothetical protein
MIDFDALVLGPCQDIFSRPVTVTPVVSQPAAATFAARGIWKAPTANVGLEDGAIMVSQDLVLGVRLADFPVAPVEGDHIEIDAYLSLPRVGVCTIDRVNDDGIGDAHLVLKKISA